MSEQIPPSKTTSRNDQFMKYCVICGFDKKVESHHIIKKLELGSDEDGNLVYLCPNHHWIADFGTKQDKIEILKLIKQETGKEGKMMDAEEQKLLDTKIKVLQEEQLCGGIFNKDFKPFNPKEWDVFKNTSNYQMTKSWLLGRGCDMDTSRKLNEKATRLILIRKLGDLYIR